jgi:hypothetical protein
MVALVVAGLITTALMVYASGGILKPGPFYLWALAPYVLFGVYTVRRSREDPKINVPACFWASLIAVAITMVGYGDAFLVHRRSTSGLAFLGVPVYVGLGSFVTAEVFARWSKGRQQHG